MAKLYGQSIKLLQAASGVTISQVANRAALSGLSPTDGDYAYIQDLDTIDKYVTSAWVDDGGEADAQSLRTMNLSEVFATVDVTDNSTTGDGTETETVRATRTLSVGSILKDGSSNKIVGNTNMDLTFNSVSYGVKELTYTETYAEADVTDSSTTGDGDETETTRATREMTAKLVMKDDEADITLASAQTATMTFDTGVTVAGSLRMESLDSSMEIDNVQEQDYSGTFQGAVTESIGELTLNSELPTLVIAGGGKSYVGNAVGLSKAISLAIDSEGTIDWELKFNGAVTKSNG